MSPEAQRTAIATHMGWRREGATETYMGIWTHPDGTPMGFLPDYINSLDAMHEAEKVLTDGQRQSFAASLCPHPMSRIGSFALDRFYAIHATAAQRAEAFLRAIGKWEESA